MSRAIGENFPLLVLGSGLGLAGAYYASQAYQDCKERDRLTSLRERKQRERREEFLQLAERYPLVPERATIVGIPFDELVEKLQRRELKAKNVLEAYIAKALVVTEEFNCVTEFIPQSLEWADLLDSLKEVKGPLHGVPICVKDDHNMPGMDTTLGLSVNLYQPQEDTAVAVRILQDAGAIPFCKTNLPQTKFSSSSSNPIFGTTVNHLNKSLSPGGSSSGTACLVGAGGAPLGTGGDIGGSVRIPAHFSGISTIKPTLGRVSVRGIMPCLKEVAGVQAVTGILTEEAKTLAKIYKILLSDSVQHLYDPLIAPVPWNSSAFESKIPLRIGYYTSLDFYPTVGDTPDTVMKAKEVLEIKGHSLVPFELVDDPQHVLEVFISLATADGGNQNYNKLKYDQVSDCAKKFMAGRSLSSYLFYKIMSYIYSPSPRELMANPDCQRSEILWEYLNEVRALKNRLLDKMKEMNLDLILSPAFPFPATRVEDTDKLLNGVAYTAYWNILDFPAGVVPFGKETATKIDQYDDQGDPYLQLVKENCKLAKDMPIGVQIIGKPYEEEMVLRILVELENSRDLMN